MQTGTKTHKYTENDFDKKKRKIIAISVKHIIYMMIKYSETTQYEQWVFRV